MMLRPWQAVAAIGIVSLCVSLAYTQENRIVVGVNNIDLLDGADALLAGDVEEGIERTLAGLRYASAGKERLTGLSNLCAGYILLERYDDALEQCNTALSEDVDYWRALANRALIHILKGRYDEADKDLDRAEELAPAVRTVRNVRELLRDRLNPVEPIIIIDDRRQPEK